MHYLNEVMSLAAEIIVSALLYISHTLHEIANRIFEKLQERCVRDSSSEYNIRDRVIRSDK